MNGITALSIFYRFPSLELPEQVQRVSLLPLKGQGLSAQMSSPSTILFYILTKESEIVKSATLFWPHYLSYSR